MSCISLQLRQNHSLYDLNQTQQSTSTGRYQSQWGKKGWSVPWIPILTFSITYYPFPKPLLHIHTVNTNRQYLFILITHLPDGKTKERTTRAVQYSQMTQHVWPGAIWKGFMGIELKDLSLKEYIILKVVAKEGLFASLKRGYFIPLVTLIIK